MISNRLAVLAIAGATVTAAAGGGYLATRHNAAAAVSAVPQAVELDRAHELEGVTLPALKEVQAVIEPAAPAPVRAERPATARPRAARAATAPAGQPTPVVVEAPSAPELPAIQLPAQAAELPGTWEPIAPEEPAFYELVVPADSVVGLEIAATVNSETAVVEDTVEARVVRDVRAAGEVAIPAGSRAIGSVTAVERGGRFSERARLGIRFHTLVLTDGTRLPVSTEAIYRLGQAPGKGTAAKIGGGAVAGAILGGILGGSKGAAIGASSGAGAGTAVVYAGDRSEATFGSGLEVTARFLSPVPVTIDR